VMKQSVILGILPLSLSMFNFILLIWNTPIIITSVIIVTNQSLQVLTRFLKRLV
jgi:hypothetical protein